MKSIIEEASSIGKAIETAWMQAGKPSEFTVRIFEESQKNMFGFTSKPAKIGIFFEETKNQQKSSQYTAPVRDVQKQDNQKHKEKEVVKVAAPKHKEQTEKPAPVKPKRDEDQQQTSPWNEQMIAYTQGWLEQLLKELNVSNTFAVTPERYHLKINFTMPIFEQPEKNRAFFRSSSHLLLQSIRNNFKRPLKGFKVILTAE